MLHILNTKKNIFCQCFTRDNKIYRHLHRHKQYTAHIACTDHHVNTATACCRFPTLLLQKKFKDFSRKPNYFYTYKKLSKFKTSAAINDSYKAKKNQQSSTVALKFNGENC